MCCPLFCHCCIIPYYSLTYLLADALPPSLLSQPSSIFLSLPPSFAGLYLLACLGGNYHSSETLSYCLHCNALLCCALPPSLHAYSTHMDTCKCIHTHMHRRHTVKYRRALKSTSTYTQRLHNPFPTPSINPLPDAAFCLFLLLCYPKQYTGTEQYRGLETLAASA